MNTEEVIKVQLSPEEVREAVTEWVMNRMQKNLVNSSFRATFKKESPHYLADMEGQFVVCLKDFQFEFKEVK